MQARLASAISTEESETESANMEQPVQTFLQTENTLLYPIEIMYASSDGTVPCTAESVPASMSQEHTSAALTGLSSTKSVAVAEFSTTTEA